MVFLAMFPNSSGWDTTRLIEVAIAPKRSLRCVMVVDAGCVAPVDDVDVVVVGDGK
jgi:hypothetical protein